MSRYFDTHIHLDCLAEPAALLDEARRAGVAGWVVPGVASAGWPGLMAAVEGHADVYAAPGVHPQAADRCTPADLAALRRLLLHPRAVAVGEVGLDRQVAVPWQVQEDVFVLMLRLALEMDKPLLIHARRGTDRLLELMRRTGAERVGGIFHAFSGSLDTARRFIDMNFVLGIGGVVTWPSARRLIETVRGVPAEALVLETDAPDMTPAPHRGQANQPAYLGLVAEGVAHLRGWSLQETARLTTANARRVLRLPQPAECRSPADERRAKGSAASGDAPAPVNSGFKDNL